MIFGGPLTALKINTATKLMLKPIATKYQKRSTIFYTCLHFINAQKQPYMHENLMKFKCINTYTESSTMHM